jgi:uncharacterized OB-fold protein
MSEILAGKRADTNVSERPIPIPDNSSEGFWQATKHNVLAIARCSRCGVFNHPPDAICAHCGSAEPEFIFQPVSGRGKVKSWTIVRQALLPGFEAEIPYVLVDIELDEQEGLRITGRLLDGPGAVIRLGQSVNVRFEHIAPDIAVPAFVLGA